MSKWQKKKSSVFSVVLKDGVHKTHLETRVLNLSELES